MPQYTPRQYGAMALAIGSNLDLSNATQAELDALVREYLTRRSDMTTRAIRSTLEYLRRCQAARAAGQPVAYTTDPAWLVQQAINRRCPEQFADDPSHYRGSCRTVQGRYPTKAEGQTFGHLRILSRDINTPRLCVHRGALGEWRRLLLARIPARFED